MSKNFTNKEILRTNERYNFTLEEKPIQILNWFKINLCKMANSIIIQYIAVSLYLSMFKTIDFHRFHIYWLEASRNSTIILYIKPNSNWIESVSNIA